MSITYRLSSMITQDLHVGDLGPSWTPVGSFRGFGPRLDPDSQAGTSRASRTRALAKASQMSSLEETTFGSLYRRIGFFAPSVPGAI